MLRIDQLYAFIARDGDGEGLAAYLEPSNGLWMPMVGADMKRMESLKPMAALLARTRGPITLARFEIRTDLETFS